MQYEPPSNTVGVWREFAGFAPHPEAGLYITEPLNNTLHSNHSTTFNRPQILRAPSTLALLLWAVLLLAALLPGGTVPGELAEELGGLFELWCVGLDFFRTSVTVGRRLVDLVLWLVAAAAAYDFELIGIDWVAWS